MESLAADGHIFYRRFMDDYIILADSHSKLRRIVRRVYCELAALGLTVHREKRYIGRTTKGFNFLGYRLHPVCLLRQSAESVRRLKERAHQLYEAGGLAHEAPAVRNQVVALDVGRIGSAGVRKRRYETIFGLPPPWHNRQARTHAEP